MVFFGLSNRKTMKKEEMNIIRLELIMKIKKKYEANDAPKNRHSLTFRNFRF